MHQTLKQNRHTIHTHTLPKQAQTLNVSDLNIKLSYIPIIFKQSACNHSVCNSTFQAHMHGLHIQALLKRTPIS